MRGNEGSHLGVPIATMPSSKFTEQGIFTQVMKIKLRRLVKFIDGRADSRMHEQLDFFGSAKKGTVTGLLH